MKKINILLIILITSFSSFAEGQNLKALIIPFKDNSINDKNDIYNNIIMDTLKNDLSKAPLKIEADDFEKNIYAKLIDLDDRELIMSYYQKDIHGKFYSRRIEESNMEKLDRINSILSKIGYRRFVPYLYSDVFKNEKYNDYNDVYLKAFNGKYDLIITGYYIESNSEIKITFKVIDVLTDRVKIVFNKSGKSGSSTFDVILDSAREFIDKMFNEIRPYTGSISLSLREKQSRIIAGDEKETFLFFNIGAVYSGFGFINLANRKIQDFNLQSDKNIYYNSICPQYNLEIYGNYKKNYYGFGFNMIIPFVYFVPNMFMRSNLTFSFLFALKKELFFSWNLSVIYIGLDKYNNNNEQIFTVFYLGLGLGFNFRYMPQKYPYYLEAGFTIVPPKAPFLISNNRNNGGPSLWNISTNYISDQSWIFPIIFKFGGGYFIKNDFGIYMRNSLYFLYISYENEKYFDNTYKYYYYGKDFGICFDIEFGVVYKGVFK